MAGIQNTKVPFGVPGIRGCAEAAERELLEGFPHESWLSADERTTPDSAHFGGADMSLYFIFLHIEYERRLLNGLKGL